MKRFNSIVILGLILSFGNMTGCAMKSGSGAPTRPQPALFTLLDYQLYDPQNRPVNLDQAIQQAASADVVILGEFHTHPAVHDLQGRMLQGLFAQAQAARKICLSMEQFERDTQDALLDYQAGLSGEEAMIEDARAWPNYRSDYRPLVEFAREHDIPVIAANAPRKIVHCVGKQGFAFLDKLDEAQRNLYSLPLVDNNGQYSEFFRDHSPEHGKKMQAAQSIWDATMAESIVQAREYNDCQVVHTVGIFHAAVQGGLINEIRQRDPNLRIVVIEPVYQLPDAAERKPEENINRIYALVKALPTRYVDLQRAGEAFKKRTDHSDCEGF